MATIYQLMVEDKQINDLYYNEDDAIDNATEIAIDSLCQEDLQIVEIWEAEEAEGLDADLLDWRLLTIVLPMNRQYPVRG